MSAVIRAFRFALDPTPRQERMLQSHAGGARFAYNWGIEQIARALDARQAEKDAREKPSTPIPGHFDLCRMWTAHKNDPASGLHWVGENSADVYYAALRDAAAAWAAYFASRAGRRAGRPVGRPRFKSKRTTQPAFQMHSSTVRVTYGPATVRKPWRKRMPVHAPRLNLPVIGSVRIMSDHHWRWRQGHLAGADRERNRRRARTLARLVAAGQARIVRVSISQEPDGIWFASVTAEVMTAPARALLQAWAHRCEQSGAPMPGTWAWKVLPLLGQYSAGEIWAALERGGDVAPDPKILGQRLREARQADPSLAASRPAACPPPTRRQRAGGTAGVDLGVRHLATLSTGQTISNPGYLEAALAGLRRAQRAASRAQKESRRRERARHKVALLHARVRRARRGAIIRAVTRLVRAHERIVVEGWDVQRITRQDKGIPATVRRARRRALADAAAGELRARLQLAAPRAGCTVIVLPAHVPTGRTCGACGAVKDRPIPPAEETWRCPACGHTADRRLNTARALVRLAAPQTAPLAGAQSRREGVSPPGRPARGRPSAKRAARSRPRGRGKTGSPGPQGPGVPQRRRRLPRMRPGPSTPRPARVPPGAAASGGMCAGGGGRTRPGRR